MSGWGSSPLARGLPILITPLRERRWIIPARAGFTGELAEEQVGGGDHPRSRGVYSWRARSIPDWIGSSPLARGLQLAGIGGDNAARIIPARAGFTGIACVKLGSVRDHPRSRGVYKYGRMGIVLRWGSSPLARGLLPERRRRRPRDWIIPARAGFTD